MAVPALAYSGFLWVVITSREKAKPNTSIAPAIAINGILGTRLEERVLGGCSIERSVPEKAAGWQACSRLFEIALVLVRFDHVACIIVNANQSMRVRGETLNEDQSIPD